MDPETRNFDRPRQAVILAGGRGERMRPLTDTRPKPMIEILGRPFLTYQLEQLRDQGFEKVLLLLGYLPEVVQDYCGDGSQWSIRLEYSVSSPDNQTARRLKIAERLLDPCFLLLYCDNYWPMQMDAMWPRFAASGAPAMLTVYSNKDGYTRNSVRVSSSGYIDAYDKSQTIPGLQGVEISYGFFRRSLIESLSDADESIESALYTPLVHQKKLLAHVTDHRYYSVGSLNRLPLTEKFLSRRPAIILDRDGVLNRKAPRGEYVRSWSEFEWIAGAKQALRMLSEAGYRIAIVSNQAGIGRKVMTETQVRDIHERMQLEITEAGGRVDAIYYCPHHWDEGCECRKPRAGMLFQAQRDLDLDLTRTPFAGDDERDGQAAVQAGCPFIPISESSPLISCVYQLLNKSQRPVLAGSD